ncbi:hypothetical protein T4D_15611, partial [Trichinella pseudospiralis]
LVEMLNWAPLSSVVMKWQIMANKHCPTQWTFTCFA